MKQDRSGDRSQPCAGGGGGGEVEVTPETGHTLTSNTVLFLLPTRGQVCSSLCYGRDRCGFLQLEYLDFNQPWYPRLSVRLSPIEISESGPDQLPPVNVERVGLILITSITQ